MSLINWILDLAGLLLWVSWRSIRFDPVVRAAPLTLAGTVRRAEPSRLRRWHFLGAVVGLLFVRAVFYVEIGPAVNWTPKLDLGLVTLAFRGDVVITELLFSFLSFGRTLVIFYSWLLALAVINRRASKSDPLQRLVLLQLGRLSRWPRWVQAILPLVFVAAVWIALHPLLARSGVLTRAQSSLHLVEQGFLVGACAYLTLKYLLPLLLFLYLVSSYVYMGESPFWDFIGTTGRNLLVPIRRIPTKVGRVDFAPLIGMVIILLVLQTLPQFIRAWLGLQWPQ